MDTQLIVGLLESSLIPTGASDCFHLVPQLDSITEGSLIISQEIKQSRRSSRQKDSNPTPVFQDLSTGTITPPSTAGQIQRKNGLQQSSFPAKKCEIFPDSQPCKGYLGPKEKTEGHNWQTSEHMKFNAKER